jgi:hypothetical protein
LPDPLLQGNTALAEDCSRNADAVLREEQKVTLARWADRHAAQLDRRLTDAWPDLEDCLDRTAGEATDRKWVPVPSLKDHLIGRVKEAARTARAQLDEGEVAP